MFYSAINIADAYKHYSYKLPNQLIEIYNIFQITMKDYRALMFGTIDSRAWLYVILFPSQVLQSSCDTGNLRRQLRASADRI